MIVAGLLIAGLLIAGLLAPIALLVWRAPEGWEDESGFHYGRRNKP